MWPDAAAAAVTDVLRHDPNARVFASYEYPDWLLLVSPPARGRVAYDGRFEVLTQRQLAGVFGYLRNEAKNPERPTVGYRLLVLNPLEDRELVRTYVHRAGVRVLFRDERVVVFDRGPRANRIGR